MSEFKLKTLGEFFQEIGLPEKLFRFLPYSEKEISGKLDTRFKKPLTTAIALAIYNNILGSITIATWMSLLEHIEGNELNHQTLNSYQESVFLACNLHISFGVISHKRTGDKIKFCFTPDSRCHHDHFIFILEDDNGFNFVYLTKAERIELYLFFQTIFGNPTHGFHVI